MILSFIWSIYCTKMMQGGGGGRGWLSSGLVVVCSSKVPRVCVVCLTGK